MKKHFIKFSALLLGAATFATTLSSTYKCNFLGADNKQ